MTTVTGESAQKMPAAREDPAPVTFERLVELHQARVARLAQRLLGWPADVEDVVQEVFVAAWRSFRQFRGESRPETWLMRITINQCRRQNRRTMMRRALLLGFARERPTQTRDEDRLEGVRESVRGLPQKY